MLLDINKNELIFSGMGNPKEFSNALNGIKDVKFRNFKNKFYVPLVFFESARHALRDYKGKIDFTPRYRAFAERFVDHNDFITINWYPAYCEIEGGPVPFHDIIPQTSYFTKDAKRSKLFETGQWDGYIHLFDTERGKFPAGLLERIVLSLRLNKVRFEIKQHFTYPEPTYKLNPVFPFVPVEDQVAAVEALDKANNGIAKLPTGFGKTSYVAAALIAKKGVRAMFLANQRVLINDAKDDFRAVFAKDDIHIGTIGDGEFDPGDITVASIQGVVAALTPPTQLEMNQFLAEVRLMRLRSEATPDDAEVQKAYKKSLERVEKAKQKEERAILIRDFLKRVDHFIVDESQVLGTDMWNTFLYACPAAYRYTLSATDTRTDGGRIQIIAATGERRFESSASEQIEKGRLSEFRGHFKKFDHKLPRDVLKDLEINYHQAYDLFIVNNEKRNDFLCDYLIKWAHEGYSVLGLVTRREHGFVVMDMLKDKGMDERMFAYVDGKTAKKERRDKIAEFRNSKFPILIGTSIFDVGFNAKNASKIVRFNAGGSEVREPQRAGRTVRVREDGSWGESIDILDINVPFFESQGFKRMKVLKEEFGSQRVDVLEGIIDGEFEVSRLQEVVETIPDKTSREAGQRVIDDLLGNREVQKVDAEPEGLEDILENRDLMSLLDELKVEDM